MQRRLQLEPADIMLADSICSDDLNTIEYPERAYEMLGPFKMGGLVGFPFFARYKMMAGITPQSAGQEARIRLTDKDGTEYDLPVSVHPTHRGETTRRERRRIPHPNWSHPRRRPGL